MSQLSLYYPHKPWFVTQKFGDVSNLAYYQANGINFKGHNGIDCVAIHGEPIYAAHDGEAWYEIDQNQGHGVVVRTNEQYDYGNGQAFFKTIFWHMIDSKTEPQYRSVVEDYMDTSKTGLQVKAGQIIGYVDSTGLSTGDHLHFGLKPQAQNEPPYTWANIEQNNGYMGAIDPAPYLNGLYACDLPGAGKALFLKDMRYDDTGAEILRLQAFLSQLGYFKGAFYPHYGTFTQNAVYAFQKDHVTLSAWENFVLQGSRVGPKTRVALNNLLVNK